MDICLHLFTMYFTFLQVIDPVCHQLFDFYRSVNTDLQHFTLELIPTLLWSYLSSPYVNDRKVSECLIFASWCFCDPSGTEMVLNLPYVLLINRSLSLSH